MLYRLEIENFYAVRDLQVVDLRVPKSVPDFADRFAPIFPGSDVRAPKTVAVFGANGSGKSTVLKALVFLAWFLRESFSHTGGHLPCERFNDAESADRPIRLAVELGGMMNLSAAAQRGENLSADTDFGVFRYELEVLPEAGRIHRVGHEALRMKRQGQGKWLRVFERKQDRTVLGSATFPLGGFARVVDKVRENASVVSTLAQFDHEASRVLSGIVERLFKNIFVDRLEFRDENTIKYLAKNPDMVAALNRELQRIDVGVANIRIEQAAAGPIALFMHQGLQSDMPWILESHGTRSFISLFPLMEMAMQQGGIAVIDELDGSIHPLVVSEIVRRFHDSTRNPFNAQLWMSCHAASLLDDLAKEEIVLCEKDHLGRARVYSLMDVESVRRSDNLYKKYLSGHYGAVPHIG
jgi:AAA15 family ATPase/GTPase